MQGWTVEVTGGVLQAEKPKGGVASRLEIPDVVGRYCGCRVHSAQMKCQTYGNVVPVIGALPDKPSFAKHTIVFVALGHSCL